jgi:hypothetical protein
VSGTDVYIGGLFTDAAGIAEADYIAKWNGSSWSALGGGMKYVFYDAGHAIALSGTDLYVGGAFMQAGGKPSYFLGRWMIPFYITSPNGGESWEVGSIHNITWTGTAGPVKIEYSTNNGSIWMTIAASTANDGSHPWTVPVAPSSQCRVRISEAADGNPVDTSDGTFTIAGFRMTSPNGGENWIVGSPQTITWATAGSFATVRIELSTNNGSIWQSITSGTTETGSYPWTVPDLISSQCLIKISDSTDGVPYDVSNAVFSIIPLPSITVTSPNGGESWAMGSTQNIAWSSTGISANVKIEYSINSGSGYSLIAASTANDGTHPWTVPLTTSSTCLVRVSDAASPSVFDMSNAVFSIVPAAGGSRRLTWTSGYSGSPDIAVDGSDRLNLVWVDNTPGNPEIYYKKSLDWGATWTANKRLTFTSGNSWSSAIAVDASGKLHAVWQDDTSGNHEIYYKKSTDGGATWTANKRLTFTSGDSVVPAIGVDSSGYLHVVWQDDTAGNCEIYYTKSIDKGATWTVGKRLTWNSGGSEVPAIALDASGYLHVVWQDDTAGNYETYYRKSTDGGTTWAANKRLTWTLGSSERPAIGVDSSGNPHVVWHDNSSGRYQISYRMSPDGGTNWSFATRLTWSSENCHDPVLAVDPAGNIHVIYCDDRTGNAELYYRKSVDGGSTWIATRRLTWTLGASEVPSLGTDSSGNLHVVWRDNTPGNYEIYYKKFQ